MEIAGKTETDKQQPESNSFWRQVGVAITAGLIVLGVTAALGGLYSLVNDLTLEEWITYILWPASALGLVAAAGNLAWTFAKAVSDNLRFVGQVHLGLILTQRILMREILRDVITAAETRGWQIEDEIADAPLPFTEAAALKFRSPDDETVDVSLLAENSQADVAAKLAKASPAHFPSNWQEPSDD